MEKLAAANKISTDAAMTAVLIITGTAPQTFFFFFAADNVVSCKSSVKHFQTFHLVCQVRTLGRKVLNFSSCLETKHGFISSVLRSYRLYYIVYYLANMLLFFMLIELAVHNLVFSLCSALFTNYLSASLCQKTELVC